MRLFIFTLWSAAWKGLTSWLSIVVSNCAFVTFPLVFWVRCGTCLFRFLIIAPLLTFPNLCNVLSQRILLIKSTLFAGTKKMAGDSQIVTAKEYLKLSQTQNIRHKPTDYSFASGPSLSLGHERRRTIKEKTISINRNWVYNRLVDCYCRMISMLYPTLYFITFGYLFELLDRISLSNNLMNL